MNKSKILLGALSVLALASTSVLATQTPRFVDDPQLRSQAALVLDTESSAVLYARNPNSPTPIASITKLMTALIVLERGQPLDEFIEITNADVRAGRGSPSRLVAGAKVSRGDLLHVALMSSDNRAAHAVARAYPGGVEAAVHAMNAKARELGMSQTRFADTSGLSSENVASASDLARLVMAATRESRIRLYSTDDKHSVVVARRAVEFRNTNYLVRKDDWHIDVQKTGFTNDAGRCLVMKATIDGRSVIIVLLDSFGKYTRTADARRIRKWLEARSQRTADTQALR